MNNEVKFSHISFLNRLKNSLKTDLRRAFTSKFNYIIFGVGLIIPILVLVMTTMNSTDESNAIFTSVWDLIGSTTSSGMDLASMCNINLVYFLFIIVACLFIGDEYKSGYSKNIFTLRGKKLDYIISKTIVLSLIGIIMLATYFIGTIIGGGVAGLPFTMSGFSGFNLVMCLLSKLFLTLFFASIAVFACSIGKEKQWISIVSVIGFNMLFFNMIPMITPITSNALNPLLTLVGSGLIATGFGTLTNIILNKTNIL